MVKMRRKYSKIAVYTIFLCFILFFSKAEISIAEGNIIYVDDGGAGDYISIQEAINNAKLGDTIYVLSGIYEENIVIDKSITLMGFGAGEKTIKGVSATPATHVIRISANYVNISGLTIQDPQGPEMKCVQLNLSLIHI